MGVLFDKGVLRFVDIIGWVIIHDAFGLVLSARSQRFFWKGVGEGAILEK